MKHSLYLAWRYMQFHKGKTAILTAALTLITYLPLAVHLLVRASDMHMMARSRSTPLLIGAKGSALDLVMHALYLVSEPLATTTMAEAVRVDDTGFAYAIPVYNRFQARGYPIVGTSLGYFTYRHLEIAAGRSLAVLGDCVLGATVAKELQLGPGDSLLSSPENLFDLAGAYPLKMHVAGVLQATHTPDDRAVFVDTKTAWIIAGLGHGHEDVATATDPQVQLEQRGTHTVASAKLLHYTEITPDNIDSFHFHGDISQFPLSAIIAVPQDEKSATLLRGRYLSAESPVQIVTPAEVIEDFLHRIFTAQRVLNAIFAVVSVAMLLVILLVMTLSLRLRQPEIDTIYKLGCSRLKIAELIAAETALIITLSLAVTFGFAAATLHWQESILYGLLW